jgi:hypothetical protein
LLPQLKEKYGNCVDATTPPAAPAPPTATCWGFFSGFSTRNITQTAAELAGTKKVPTPVSDKDAGGK